MNATTIDAGIDLQTRAAVLTWPAGEPRKPKRVTSPLTLFGGDEAREAFALFDQDEARERERLLQIERRLLELEVALFADFSVQFVEGARAGVMRLFVACPSVRVPSISGQADGQLICTWTNVRRERVVVRFSGRGAIQYAITRASLGGPDGFHRQWGSLAEPAVFWDENPAARRIAE